MAPVVVRYGMMAAGAHRSGSCAHHSGGRFVGRLPVSRWSDVGLVGMLVRWLSEAVDRKKKQGRNCQKGRDWGVHTHQ